jgi:hypothetical protein
MGKGILSTGNRRLRNHELLLQFYRSFRKYQVKAEHLRRLPDRRRFDWREERDNSGYLHLQSGEEEGMREGEDEPPEESSHAVRRPVNGAAGCRRRWSAAR